MSASKHSAAAHRIEEGDGWELHHCDWRDADLPKVDAVIEDPPYGQRTHDGQRHERASGRGTANARVLVSDVGLGYGHLAPDDVAVLVGRAAEICTGWCNWMCSHDLIPAYEAAAVACGRYGFAPVPIVMPGMNVRLAGDGPSNWTVYMMVTRTTTKKCWSTKPGWYQAARDYAHGRVALNPVKGGKPLGLMEAIIFDYTERGDLVLDRYAGGGTTGVAALRNGRRFIGYERHLEHFKIAAARLRSARFQPTLFDESEIR